MESNEMNKTVEDLESKFARGLQFADMLGFSNQQNIKENATNAQTLIELLIAKGLIRLDEFEERKKAVSKYIEEKMEKNEPKVKLIETEDKYAFKSDLEIDCTNRVHLCKASCCKLWFALSVQDLNEGVVKWDYHRPYGIAHREDGYCVHNDSCKNGQYKVYDNRPLVCRSYDCSEDKRIWTDFENRIPNPNIEKEGWPNV